MFTVERNLTNYVIRSLHGNYAAIYHTPWKLRRS